MVKPHTCKCSICHAKGFILPGWVCPSCHGFNGAAKEILSLCRSCGAINPSQLTKQRSIAKRQTRNHKIQRLSEAGYTPKQLGEMFKLSRSSIYEILKNDKGNHHGNGQ